MSSLTYANSAPLYDVLPYGWAEARTEIHERSIELANIVNERASGQFLDTETDSNHRFIPGASGEFRSVLRTVYQPGALPNNATMQFAHGVNVNSDFTLFRLYGSATDPVNFKGFSFMSFEETQASNLVQLSYDDTYIYVKTNLDYSAYTRTVIVFEYVQEV